jgi:hypothetical protein
LHFISWCNDEEEQQFFDKGWILMFWNLLACSTSSLSLLP